MTNVVAEQPGPSGGSPSRFGLDRRRLIALLLLAGLLFVALGLLDLPNLDGVREDVAIATSADAVRSGVPADNVSNCFQGFCFEDDAGVLDRWWGFSSTFLRLTWIGLALAILGAGIVDTALFPIRGRSGGLRFASAEAVVSSPVPAPGAGAAVVAGRSLNAASIVVGLVLLSPFVIGIRVGLGLVAVLLVGWILGRGESWRGGWKAGEVSDEGWSDAARAVVGDSLRASLRWFVVLVPAFVAAAAIGGIVPQYLTEEGVTAVVGDHMLGITVVVVVGLLLRLPTLFEFPLVTAALLVGMGRVAAGVLLFAAALGGTVSWRAAADKVRSRAVALAGLLLFVGTAGGGVALAASTLIETATVPTITFDGEACTYTGPMRFGPGVADFVVRNDHVDTGQGHTMAIVVGRLPDNVSMDHFELEVAANPTAELPGYFTVAGTREFVFPGMEEPAQITFHTGGRYAAVCLNGGGHYVIFEFSMPQPMGWFDEFRSTFTSYVAPQVFTVEG